MSEASEPIPARRSPPPGAESEPLPRLISCSPDRTLLAERGPQGDWQLVKIYERGSLDEARAEATIGELAVVPGVVRYREARRDPRTGRPSVVMDYHSGLDIEQWVGEHGPLPPSTAARIGAKLAATLAGIHAVSHRDAPRGVVHRDVKPSNVFLTGNDVSPETAEVLLLDFEHALPAGAITESMETEVFTGGTHGYAPPEAYAGAEPDAAFDVFGLGATLHIMLTGRPIVRVADLDQVRRAVCAGERTPLRGFPDRLTAIVEACLARDPGHRPAMAEIATELAEAATEGDEEQTLDRALAAIQREHLDEAASLLEAVAPGTSPRRRQELERMLTRARRIVASVEGPPEVELPSDARGLARALTETIPQLVAWLARFPASPRAVAQSRRAIRGFDDLLGATPREVAAAKRTAEFREAESLLEETVRAAQCVALLPKGRPSSATAADPWMPSQIERDPLRYLQLALQDVRDAASTHAILLGKLHDAETELNLGEAERVLDSAASLYSGASSVVAGLKDRLHRLGFYVERISQPTRGLEELGEQLAIAGLDLDLAPLIEFQALCSKRAAEHRLESQGARGNNPRVLHQMLHDLLTSFSHVEPLAHDAVAVLDQTMESLTDHCWQLIEDADIKLSAEPIPVRPLQSIVHRIDALRLLEVPVDRPDHPRAELLDAHERLRLKVDQARTARDRLARGAEAAMERGHLTTALYDMKRAVDQFSGEHEDMDQGGRRLIEQLEKARRKKTAIEQAAAENMRLAAQYSDLQDDPNSRHEARLAVLVERQRVLGFLVANLQEERVEPYRNDLRDVSVSIAQERAEHAEAVLDATTDLERREEIARRMVKFIKGQTAEGMEPGGRVLRILQHWERHLQRTRRQLRERDKAHQAAQARRRRRRRTRVLVGVSAILVVAATGVYASGMLGGKEPLTAATDDLAPQLVEPFELKGEGGTAHFDTVQACIALDQFVKSIERAPDHSETMPAQARVVRSARRLVDSINGVIDRGPGFSLEQWGADFAATVADYDTDVRSLRGQLPAGDQERELIRHLARFSTRAQEAGLYIAALGARTPEERRAVRAAVEQEIDRGRLELSQEGLAAIRSLLQ